MAQTYLQVLEQIQRLQSQAEAIKSKEVQEFIARTREAIEAYGLKPADLFGSAIRTPAAAAKKIKLKSKRKFTDGQGNFWSGHGRKPRWFEAALKEGKTPEDMRA